MHSSLTIRSVTPVARELTGKHGLGKTPSGADYFKSQLEIYGNKSHVEARLDL